MDLDLAQVRAFVAVADHGHFGQAARTLSLSQQALSKRVARLERHLGQLLDRRPGAVTPTAVGQRFLPAARHLLELADRAVAEAHGSPAAPLRADVWGEMQSPARVMRTIAAAHPDLIVELSMRRDLAKALTALQRHEIDLAFGNVANLACALPPQLSAELILTDTIAMLVNNDSPLADRAHLTPADLIASGLWWPASGSSQELRDFTAEYADAIGARLDSRGPNLGLDALVERVRGDPTLVAPVVTAWPLAHHAGVRVLPLRPAPQFPWYAVWRTADSHPYLPRTLQALRAARPGQPPPHQAWLPRAAVPQPDTGQGLPAGTGPARRRRPHPNPEH